MPLGNLALCPFSVPRPNHQLGPQRGVPRVVGAVEFIKIVVVIVNRAELKPVVRIRPVLPGVVQVGNIDGLPQALSRGR